MSVKFLLVFAAITLMVLVGAIAWKHAQPPQAVQAGAGPGPGDPTVGHVGK